MGESCGPVCDEVLRFDEHARNLWMGCPDTTLDVAYRDLDISRGKRVGEFKAHRDEHLALPIVSIWRVRRRFGGVTQLLQHFPTDTGMAFVLVNTSIRYGKAR